MPNTPNTPCTIRQQFPLSEAIDKKYDALALELGKRPNDLKREILTALADVPTSCYYIALGECQKIAKSHAPKK